MKGGKTPIHIMRWAPADYHADEHVKLLKARRDYRTLTFYRHFLDASFLSGGDLPADPEALAAVVDMPRKDVERSLQFCLGRLLTQDGDRIYQGRVRRDVADELEFREMQAERGKRGGRPKRESGGFNLAKPVVVDTKSPPSPSPSPSPSPAPAPNVPAVPAGPTVVAWSRLACDAWIERLGGTAPGGQIGRALKPLVDRHGWEIVRQAWVSYLRQVEPEYASAARFASTFGRWGGTAPPGAKSTVTERTVANLEAWVAGKEGKS